MKVIHKLPLHAIGTPLRTHITTGAKPVAFQYQAGVPTWWLELPPDWEEEKLSAREFQIFGTGREIPNSAVYIGTVQDDWLVWHLYEVFP